MDGEGCRINTSEETVFLRCKLAMDTPSTLLGFPLNCMHRERKVVTLAACWLRMDLLVAALTWFLAGP